MTTTATPTKPITCLQMAALTKKLSMSRGTIYNMLNDPDSNFPPPFSFGGRGKYYFEHEIDAWLLSQQQQHFAKGTQTH